MHELSLALEVVDIAAREAEKHGVSRILEIDIEVGDLSGVEPDAFRSALEVVRVKTLLEKTDIRIIRKMGRGICSECHEEYEMKERLSLCPVCNGYPSKICGGDEFRVVSLLAE